MAEGMILDRRQFATGAAFAAGFALVGRPTLAAPDSGAVICTLLVDAASGETIRRDGPCERRFSPCSTFKVAIALMGFDARILEDAHHPIWDYRPEFGAVPKGDRKPVDPTIWLRDSIVWYSQQVTERLGADRFRGYVASFAYGNDDVSGDPGKANGLTRAWLMSSLQISSDEQAAFIGKILNRRLPVSRRAHEMTVESLPTYPASGGWLVHGKSGSGFFRSATGAIDRSRPQGWFVGWAEKKGRRVLFARLELGDRRIAGFPGPVARTNLLNGFAALVGA